MFLNYLLWSREVLFRHPEDPSERFIHVMLLQHGRQFPDVTDMKQNVFQ